MMPRMLKARTTHECHACGRTVSVGEWYGLRCLRKYGEWYFRELCMTCAEKEGMAHDTEERG